MNSDQFTPDTPDRDDRTGSDATPPDVTAPDASPTDATASDVTPQDLAGSATGPAMPRRSRPRRSTRASQETAATGPVVSTDVTSDTATPEAAAPAAPRRSRRRGAAAPPENARPDTENATTPLSSGTETVATNPLAEIIVPLTTQEGLVSAGMEGEGATGEAPLAEAPIGRSRRRGRGGRGRGGADETNAETAAYEGEPELVVAEPLPDDDPASIAEPADENGSGAVTEGTTGTGRRRRRGRGGRGRGAVGAIDDGLDGSDGDIDALPINASPDNLDNVVIDVEPPEPVTIIANRERDVSPAVLRRFDHRDWRDALGRATGATQPRESAPNAAQSVAASATPGATSAAAPGAETRSGAPAPFERPDRVRRFNERPSFSTASTSSDAATGAAAPNPESATADLLPATERASEEQAARFTPMRQTPAPSTLSAPSTSAPRETSPIIAPRRAAPSTVPATTGGSTDERLERLLAQQAAMLEQQGQALQSLATTMASLQGSLERLSATGITGGMPRAGMFVDAPNIVYAAENARVNIDYGRMLDFLGRGREMVHAIVYAPVTEDTGYRFENQRFVAPFMNNGYKLVTKPLKRFPDGTAKGNFDIELAIDIVTMSQRLDVVILISGDSDFSRLVELIQSRGVRVEVVAFASNVSWELVQMADVFVDVGQYLDEFQTLR